MSTATFELTFDSCSVHTSSVNYVIKGQTCSKNAIICVNRVQAESFFSLLKTMSTPKATSKPTATPPTAPSDDEIFKTLKKHDPAVYSVSESNAPWFETLFPNESVPAIKNDKIEKDVFNRLFKDLSIKAKTILKSELNFKPAHLPKSIAAKISEVIIQSIKKSSASKAPARIVKKAAHLTPASSTKPKDSTSSKKKDVKPSKPVPATPQTPVKAPSAKTSTPQTKPKSKTAPTVPSPSKITPISDIIEALRSSSSPTLYYAADKTPTFKDLFPGTTMPSYTHISGNVRVEKQSFTPLLTIRIKAAYRVLSSRNISVTKLPAKFLSYQTRLICRSIEKTVSDRKASAKAKKEQKAKAKSSKPSVVYTSSVNTAKLSQVPAKDTPPPTDTEEKSIRSLREFRALCLALKATSLSPKHVKPDSRIATKLFEHPYFHDYFTKSSSYSSDEKFPRSETTFSFVHEPTRSTYCIVPSTLQILENRSSMMYESILSDN